jgi:hypothetical protein
MFVRPSLCQSFIISVRPSFCPSVFLFVCPSFHLIVCQYFKPSSVCLSFCPSAHLSACLSTCPSVYHSSVNLCVWLSSILHVCPHIGRVSVCLSGRLLVFLSALFWGTLIGTRKMLRDRSNDVIQIWVKILVTSSTFIFRLTTTWSRALERRRYSAWSPCTSWPGIRCQDNKTFFAS